jgi:hypothetical protein
VTKNNPTVTGGEMGEIKRCYYFSAAHHATNPRCKQTATKPILPIKITNPLQSKKFTLKTIQYTIK